MTGILVVRGSGTSEASSTRTRRGPPWECLLTPPSCTSTAPRYSIAYQVTLTGFLSLSFSLVLFDRNALSFLMPFVQPEHDPPLLGELGIGQGD